MNELEDAGIRPLRADIRKKDQVFDALKEQEIVFHCAAFPSPWGNYELFYQANVIGTRNVAQACMENKVKRLVYVSTPSIYFTYNSRMNVKESDPLPEPISNYARTKLLAEEEIDKGSANGLAVIPIRPRALFGEGDTVIFPRLIRRIKSGGLPILGNGENIVDLTYIENVVDALLLCAESPADTLGKKYYISNGEPVKIWKLIERVCDELKYTAAPPATDFLSRRSCLRGYSRVRVHAHSIQPRAAAHAAFSQHDVEQFHAGYFRGAKRTSHVSTA